MNKFNPSFAAAVAVIIISIALQGCKATTEKEAEVQNIILMIGDGMGLSHVSALMLAEDYRPINMERAPVGGFVKTYSANNRVTDSSASATTYASAVKTNNSWLGIDADGNPVATILEKANKAGMATGLAVTTHIQHATPGAFFGHVPNRDMYEEISLGLLETDIDVAIGGGMRYIDPEKRKDRRDVRGELQQKGYLIVDSLKDLDGISEGKVLALAERGYPVITRGRDPGYLPGATAKALEILTNNSKGKGFFLMVEGSYIDSAAHANDAEATIAETKDFDNAVGVAMDYAETHPGTLVIILADHETGGLSIPSGNADFLRSDSGIEFRWGTGGHSATMIPMFVYGPRAEYFSGIMENIEVGRRMQEVLGLW